jgi:hypothetical protein
VLGVISEPLSNFMHRYVPSPVVTRRGSKCHTFHVGETTQLLACMQRATRRQETMLL